MSAPDPTAGVAIPPSMPAATTHLLTVASVRDVTPRMRRVTLTGDTLEHFAALPGQDVVVHLVDTGGSSVRRRYTVCNLDRSRRRFDLDVVRHGEGPGARWAEHVTPGERIEIFGPRGKVVPSAASWQLFVGDESALPAVVEMVRALPAGARAVVVAEVLDPGEQQPVAGAADVDVRWLHRGGAAAGAPHLLEAAVEGVVLPDADRHAYVFAESRVVRLLRDMLVRRGLSHAEISAKGYWNLGRAARD